MSRSSNKPPALTHHKASGKAVVRLSGKDFYLGPYGSQVAKDEYDRVVGEWLKKGRTIADEENLGFTVAELVAGFIKDGAIPDSQADAYKAVITILLRLYRRQEVDAFGPLALKVVREQMINKGWKRRTINHRVILIRRIFKWGLANELVKSETIVALSAVEGLKEGKTIAPESQPIKPVPVDFVIKTIQRMTPMMQAMVQVHLHTGMRASELCDMRTGDIDRSGEIWVYRPRKHKTMHRGKTREIAIGPKAQAQLTPYLLDDGEAFIFSPTKSDRERRDAARAARTTPLGYGTQPGDNVRVSPKKKPGTRYCTASYRRSIYYACDLTFPVPADLAIQTGEDVTRWRKRLGIEQWAKVLAWRSEHRFFPLQVRHTFATMARREFTHDHAQKALGHAHAKTTEIYAELSLDLAREVAAGIG